MCPFVKIGPFQPMPVVQFAEGGGPSLARLKPSSIPVVGKSLGGADGEAEALGETEGDSDADGLRDSLGETDGDSDALGDSEPDGLTLALGDTLGLSLADGETEALGETDGDIEADGERDGETDGEGETDALGETDGEPANAVRISIMPTAVGFAADSVNAAEAVEPVALNGWSQHVMPRPSMRSVQPAGEVNVGVPSATHVTFMQDLAAVRVSASHVEEVEEAFSRRLTAPIGAD